ncbi:hypothetical protein FQG39_22905 [Escherichia coli]|nr:hypothetical protein [Escherichia coli]
MSRVVIELNEGYKKAACAAHSHWLIVYFTLPTFITFPTKLDSLRFSFAASVNIFHPLFIMLIFQQNYLNVQVARGIKQGA